MPNFIFLRHLIVLSKTVILYVFLLTDRNSAKESDLLRTLTQITSWNLFRLHYHEIPQNCWSIGKMLRITLIE